MVRQVDFLELMDSIIPIRQSYGYISLQDGKFEANTSDKFFLCEWLNCEMITALSTHGFSRSALSFSQDISRAKHLLINQYLTDRLEALSPLGTHVLAVHMTLHR